MKKRNTAKNQELARKARRIISSCSTHEVANLTASGIAQQLGVSPCLLSRAFTNCYSYTLQKALARKKIIAFDRLVSSGTRTVQDALEKLDIRCTSHFISKYRTLRQRTPGEFCSKIRKQRRSYLKKKKTTGSTLPVPDRAGHENAGHRPAYCSSKTINKEVSAYCKGKNLPDLFHPLFTLKTIKTPGEARSIKKERAAERCFHRSTAPLFNV